VSPAAPDRPGRAIGHAAAWSAVGYSLAMASPLLWGDGDSLVGALIAATWSASPAYGAAMCAVASRTRAGAAFFFGVGLLAMAWFAWVLFDVSVLHPSSTGGIIYLTLPLLQWGALVLVIALAALLGWRARDNWPDPPAGEGPPESGSSPVVQR
jgi:hypothetical protein